MNWLPLLPVALVVAALLWPAKWDPAIRIKERQIRNGTHPESPTDPAVAAISRGECPDCGSTALLGGPSGGMSQNVACNGCLSEFNVHHTFGGLFGVDRSGKLTEQRARVFGIEPDEYRSIAK